MARTQVIEHTCDRCGNVVRHAITPESPTYAEGWGKVEGTRLGGIPADNVKVDGNPADLCSLCYTGFLGWYNSAAAKYGVDAVSTSTALNQT